MLSIVFLTSFIAFYCKVGERFTEQSPNVSIAVSQGCLGADMKHFRRHVEKDPITIAHHKLPHSESNEVDAGGT